MKLNKLIIKNYRCFDSLEIDLNPELTVFIAPNGTGKTTVLDAARVAVWPFIKGFDLGSQTGKSASIQPSDVRLQKQKDGNMEPKLPSSITAIGEIFPSRITHQWTQTRERIKTGTNTLADQSTRAITKEATALEKQARDGMEEVTLPLVSYLGTSRLWFEGRFTSEAKDAVLDSAEYSRTSGYLNCLSYSSSFKAFTLWYGWVYRSYLESQIYALQNKSDLDQTGVHFKNTVEVIQQAVDALVKNATGWHRLEYSHRHQQQLVMHHEQHGIMPVDMLSDGLRNAVAMVADLAFRAHKLNPHLGANAALQTPGIALIDEVDMFLHPTWQQNILGCLRSAFPLTQFIVTTHSPQVLSTVPRDNIRVLAQDESGQITVKTPDFSPLAHESGDALAKIMGTHREPPLALQDDIRRYEQLVRAGQEQTEEAQTLRNALHHEGYQFHESDLTTWRFLAARKAGKVN